MKLEIINDEYYRACITLAEESKSRNVCFGAVLVNGYGEIIGGGWNRRKNDSDRLPMGARPHAELVAAQDALLKGKELKGELTMYVAGFLPQEGKPYILKGPTYSCRTCPGTLKRLGVGSVAIPSSDRWNIFTVDQALEYARKDFPRGVDMAERRRELSL
jgi:tRNA(Arg) A34 adenosine deaminase TadA